MLPGEWVTLQDVYHCAIDKDLFARKNADLAPDTHEAAATALTTPYC